MEIHDKDSATPGRESSTWRQGGKFWIYGIFGAFAVFMGGVGVFLFIAFSQDYDLVRKDYYEAEKTYDAHQSRAQRALDTEHTLEVSYQKDSRKIVVDFGKGQTGPVVATLHLYRASDAEKDEVHKLEFAQAPYKRDINAAHLAPGKWTAKLTWVSDHEEYFSEVDLII